MRNYGRTEVKIYEDRDFIEEVEVKTGKNVRHGRNVIIYNNGSIKDEFNKEGKAHGP